MYCSIREKNKTKKQKKNKKKNKTKEKNIRRVNAELWVLN